MIDSRRWQILALITMALVGVGFGIWLVRTGFITLGGFGVDSNSRFGSSLPSRLPQMSRLP
jgi:hypothetical protein